MGRPTDRLLGLLVLLSAGFAAAAAPVDPLQSPTWSAMHERVLGGAPVRFNPAVRVLFPDSAEDATRVPVHVEAQGLVSPQELVIFADLNPITEVLRLVPQAAVPALSVGVQMKVQQATPIRAAVRDGQGVWHVGGGWISAAGGGCGVPSRASSDPDWNRDFGLASARRWVREQGAQSSARVNVLIHHPMDTGFIAGTPRFHLEQMEVRDVAGAPLLTLALTAAVSENPILSLDLAVAGDLSIEARDNNGNRFPVQWTP